MGKTDKSAGAAIPFWWQRPLEDLIQSLKVDPNQGLSREEVEKNRLVYGSNALEEIKPSNVLELIFESVKEPMMLLLLAIALLSLLFGKAIEAGVMVFVVAAYVAVEFINKYRSDRTMSRLRALTQPETKVLRGGKLIEIPTADIVVGDIVILSEGMRVPGDLRLIESFGLIINEASLTGESLPVQKDAHAKIGRDTPLAERRNCAFSGTVVLSGEGKGAVLAVGKESELGTIAKAVQAERKERTYLQEAMTNLAKALGVLAILVSILVPLVGFLRGLQAQEMILTWLSLTFLMIPEQLPVIITMALALASFELSNKKLNVKRLRGVETLGQTTAIVADKTGTITENKMKVLTFIDSNGEKIDSLSEQQREKLDLCLPNYSNDPTDAAIREALGPIERKMQYMQIEGFKEKHPWRALTYQNNLQAIAGEPEQMIETSTLSKERKEKLLGFISNAKGYRVVAFALNREFLALAVLSDPVRLGVKEAVANLNKAGIATYMATGDHPTTADRIAKEIGLDSALLTGSAIDQMIDSTLLDQLKIVRVFARIAPSQKQRLVSLLKQKGQCVAVIGDGINDAPAIKAANLGIAMGEIGTDLAKEAADLILTDDNFVHLPDAVAIGRKALDNFRKGFTYYLTAKAILLSIFIIPVALGVPFPFAPIHIILTELLMDLASSTIFVTERAEPDLMSKPAQRITNFLSKKIGFKILKNGTLLAVGILSIYLWIYYSTANIALAQTSAFVTWLLGHILLALNLKQEKLPLLKQGIAANRFGLLWLAGMVLFSIAITAIPVLHPLLKTTALPWSIWAIISLVAVASTCWIEVMKKKNSKFAR